MVWLPVVEQAGKASPLAAVAARLRNCRREEGVRSSFGITVSLAIGHRDPAPPKQRRPGGEKRGLIALSGDPPADTKIRRSRFETLSGRWGDLGDEPGRDSTRAPLGKHTTRFGDRRCMPLCEPTAAAVALCRGIGRNGRCPAIVRQIAAGERHDLGRFCYRGGRRYHRMQAEETEQEESEQRPSHLVTHPASGGRRAPRRDGSPGPR